MKEKILMDLLITARYSLSFFFVTTWIFFHLRNVNIENSYKPGSPYILSVPILGSSFDTAHLVCFVAEVDKPWVTCFLLLLLLIFGRLKSKTCT